jgi:hypothetical protein
MGYVKKEKRIHAHGHALIYIYVYIYSERERVRERNIAQVSKSSKRREGTIIPKGVHSSSTIYTHTYTGCMTHCFQGSGFRLDIV